MVINTDNLVSITEANQNFSRVARLVDENGAAVILKNNTPRYVLIEFSQLERLTKRQILLLHEQLLQEFGGTPGVRDEGLLDSALAAPFQTFDGQSLYPSVQAKAAQLGFGLVCNHPFVDGNKRIGTHVMLVFLALNGIDLSYTQQELIDMIFAVASSQASAADLLQWIIQHQN